MYIRSFTLTALALLALLLVPVAEAAADSGSLSSPGTYCTSPKLATSSYSSYGEADQYVKFTIWYGATYPPSSKIYQAKDVTYFPEQTFNYGGWFQTCVINNSGATATFFIQEFHD